MMVTRLLLLGTFLSIFSLSSPILASEEDRAALIALYQATGGDNWTDNSGWRASPTRSDGFNEDPCGEPFWHGVQCDQGRVTALFLIGNRLVGPIPPELSDLSNLVELDLFRNRLTGPIPPQLGALANLRFLYLDNNQLAGPIPPELGDLTNLEELSLYNNQLAGTIPPELGNLAKLRYFYLDNNHLSGSIPPELGDLESVLALVLTENDLEGEVPPEVAALPNGVLDLRYNRLKSVAGGLDAELNQAQRGDALWESLQNVSAVYPQLAIGAGFEVVLIVSSRSSVPWSGRVYLDGGRWPEERPWSADGVDMKGKSSFEITLEPLATKRIVLTSSSGLGLDGWVSLRAEGNSRPEDVAAAFFYNLSGASGLSDSTGVGPSVLGNEFFFPVQRSSSTRTVLTGVALRSVVDPVTLTLLDEHGAFVDEVNVTEDSADLVGDLFADLPGDFIGSIRAYSSWHFFLTVLRVELTQASGVQLTSVPATRVPLKSASSSPSFLCQ